MQDRFEDGTTLADYQSMVHYAVKSTVASFIVKPNPPSRPPYVDIGKFMRFLDRIGVKCESISSLPATINSMFEYKNSERKIIYIKYFECESTRPETFEPLIKWLIEVGVPYCVKDYDKLSFYKYNSCINPYSHRIIMQNVGKTIRISEVIKPFRIYLAKSYSEITGKEYKSSPEVRLKRFNSDKELELIFLTPIPYRISSVTKAGNVLLVNGTPYPNKIYTYTLPPNFVLKLIREQLK
jgi:hypothetical protein